MPDRPHLAWRSYLLRFIAAWFLALLIWVLAVNQTNPVTVRIFNNIAVQYEVDEGFSLGSPPLSVARVLVRAQQSVINLISSEDVIVRADFRRRAEGTHTVPLQVIINRAGALGDSQPTQVTANLQAIISQQKPIELVALGDVPADYDYDPLRAEALQAQVIGPSERVNQVALVRGEIDLRERRDPFEANVTLLALDANGKRINDVKVDPETTRVQVNVVARDDVRQVAVRPNIQLQTLSAGYVLSSFSYAPQFVYLSGAPSALSALGSTVETQPISLAGRRDSYETSVGLILPPDILVLGETRTIQLSIGIEAQIATRQFDNIPLSLVGLGRGLRAEVSPERISVVLTGPSAQVDSLKAEDFRAVVDLSSARLGNQEIVPRLDIGQDNIDLPNFTLLPPFVTVVISQETEATATPSRP